MSRHFFTIYFKSVEIPVLALGKGWLAVDKPAGLTVHNETGRDLCTIMDRDIREKPALYTDMGPYTDFGIHPVHRLDKETSGVLLMAAERETFRLLSMQFESRRIQKRYIAILHGPVVPPDSNERPEAEKAWGTWQWPLAKEAGGRKNPAGSGPKVFCETRYRVLYRSVHYSLAEIEILTGRKHQIRRHAKLAGHPVAGDDRYGSTRAINFLKTNHAFDRLGLHALSLTFCPPGETAPLTIETAGIPIQMRELFEKDRGSNEPQI